MQPTLPGIPGPTDLRDLCRAAVAIDGAYLQSPRAQGGGYRRTVELLESEAVQVVEPSLDVACAVDGIQAQLILTFRSSEDGPKRPVSLAYVAAGAYGYSAAPRRVDEELVLATSYLDEAWSRALPTNVSRLVLDGRDQQSLMLEEADWLDASRRRLEEDVTRSASWAAGRQFVVLDGSLRHVGPLPVNVVSVAKTHRQQWLADERGLALLRAGDRSPAFRILSGTRRYPDVVSAYVRLFDTPGPWQHGLVRIEVPDGTEALRTLDALAAFCLAERQTTRDDPRWDVHLDIVRRTEMSLRARRPGVFEVCG